MRRRLIGFWKRLNLAQQFMVASFVILLSGMLVIGWWVGRQIKTGVINRTAATTALYVDSFVAPHLQEVGTASSLAPERMDSLGRLLMDTPLGQQIVAFKVWDHQGRILYSTSLENIGREFPIGGRLASAFQGQVASSISNLRSAENIEERKEWKRLLETYSPVRLEGTNQVIAVAEFYQTANDLEKEVFAAQARSWMLVGGATLVMYALLSGIVRRGSNIIARQEGSLRDQVSRLTALLNQNAKLHERVRRAATRTTALNERFLRRISAELHDGPAQELSLALLRLDGVTARCAQCPVPGADGRPADEDLKVVESALTHALQEVRTLAAGLRLPELDQLTVAETVARVVRTHEQRTGTSVEVSAHGLPAQAPLPVKITLYRLIQEALNNAYRHGGGVAQRVHVRSSDDSLHIEIADQGPGFEWERVAVKERHLGLVGMRERVESLGGRFHVESQPGAGARVGAVLPVRMEEAGDEL